MIPEFNLPAIRQGDTYVLPLSFWEDECETTGINVASDTFKLMAKNSAGTTQFTWTNADFVVGATNQRTVTLSSVTTAAYPQGEFIYDLQVTTVSGTYTWMQGYIQVQSQITS
jgi:hypothetical protein